MSLREVMKDFPVIKDEEEFRAVHKRAMVRGFALKYDWFRRVPLLLAQRSWPAEDELLVGVLIYALTCFIVGARATIVKRPKAADGCWGLWMEWEGDIRADRVISQLCLEELLKEPG